MLLSGVSLPIGIAPGTLPQLADVQGVGDVRAMLVMMVCAQVHVHVKSAAILPNLHASGTTTEQSGRVALATALNLAMENIPVVRKAVSVSFHSGNAFSSASFAPPRFPFLRVKRGIVGNHSHRRGSGRARRCSRRRRQLLVVDATTSTLADTPPVARTRAAIARCTFCRRQQPVATEVGAVIATAAHAGNPRCDRRSTSAVDVDLHSSPSFVVCFNRMLLTNWLRNRISVGDCSPLWVSVRFPAKVSPHLFDLNHIHRRYSGRWR